MAASGGGPRTWTERDLLRDYLRSLVEGRDVGACAEAGPVAMQALLRQGFEVSRARLAAGGEAAGSDAREPGLLALGRAKAEQLASAQPPLAPGAVAFVGSSTFTYWRRLAEDFEGHRVYNAAFGGSGTAEQLDEELFERLVARHAPSCVVYFCGTNDLARGRSADFAVEGFVLFYRRLRARLPAGTRVVYVAVGLTPFFLEWAEPVQQAARVANAAVKAFCDKSGDPELFFVDHNDEAWASDLGCYVGDHHHLNDRGHSCLAKLIRPCLGSCGVAAAPWSRL